MATEQTIPISGTPTEVSGVTVPFVKTSDLEIYVGKGKVESIEVTNAGAGYTNITFTGSAGAGNTTNSVPLVFSGGGGSAPTVRATVTNNQIDSKFWTDANGTEFTGSGGSDYTTAPNISISGLSGGTGGELTAKIYAKKTEGTSNDYTISGTSGSATIKFTSALSSGDKVLVKRVTDVTTAANTFNAGSAITAADLNNSFNQLRYKAEELPNVTSTAVTNGDKGDINVSGSSWTIDSGVVTSAKLANDIDIAGTLDVTGALTVDTGIRPDTDEGAYLGQVARPFSDAHIGEITIANGISDLQDRTISTASGNLNIDSTGGTVTIDDNATISGTLGVTGATTVSDNLTVNGTTTLNQEVIVNTGIIPDTDEGAYLGTVAKPFDQVMVGEIKIASTDDNTIDTVEGNLELDSATGTTVIDDNCNINGTLAVNGKATVTGGPFCLGDGSEKTISSGSITVTTSYHRVDTEGDAASDNLDKIECAAYTTGQMLVIRSVHDDRNVVVRHNQHAGQSYNIMCDTNLDLNDNEDTLIFIWDVEWHRLSFESND